MSLSPALDRGWIERRLPHRDRMCLLDEVMEWDAVRIVCRSGSHRAADHPLRRGERLGIACAIEYAAQAMALHGSLVAATLAQDPGPRAGYLASVRDVRFGAARIDDIGADLLCTATRVAGDARTVLYEFEIAAERAPGEESHWLIGGRATIVLQPGAAERMHGAT